MDLALGRAPSTTCQVSRWTCEAGGPSGGHLFLPSLLASGDRAIPEGRGLTVVSFLPNFSSFSFPEAAAAHFICPGPLPVSLAQSPALPAYALGKGGWGPAPPNRDQALLSSWSPGLDTAIRRDQRLGHD